MQTEYEKKRSFDKTPEPRASSEAERQKQLFVIHRHEATRLHYDLRVFNGTALSSWAVPKGFSYRPTDKHLAVKTEDHPTEYLEFEGVIPRGEYGGGTMRVWDSGPFDLARGEDVNTEIATGELKLILFGRRLRGEWHLVNTNENEWLLFKSKDQYAREEEYLLTPSIDISSLQSIDRPPAPMRPGRVVEPFDESGWVFELCFPGVMVRVETGVYQRVRSVRGRDLTDKVQHLQSSLSAFRCASSLLDGVLVCNGEGGIPDSKAAETSLESEDSKLSLYLYDMVLWDGYFIGDMPLSDRKEVLRSVVPASESVLFVDSVASQGVALAGEAARLGLGALVAKRLDAPYRPGKAGSWRKVDCTLGPVVRAAPRPRVRFTNRDKIFWPGAEITKGDLIDHYAAVAEYLLPHLHGRAVHLHRYPNGIEGKDFYQRRVPEHTPDWIETVEIVSDGRSERFVICNDRETLLYLANLGSIDLHPWMSLAESPDIPTWSVIDIDAKQSDFKTAVKAVREIGKVLSGISVTSGLKTSGGDGLHIFIPLVPEYGYEQSRMFAEAISRIIAMRFPDIITVEKIPEKRGPKIYLDYLRNVRGQTVIAPYVARPRPGAPVSMPILWDELDSSLDPGTFNVLSAAERINRTGDLFRQVLDKPQGLQKAIADLEQYIQSN